MQDARSDKPSASEVVERAMRTKLRMKDGEAVPAKEYDKITRIFSFSPGRSEDTLSLEREALGDLAVLSRFKKLESISLPRSALSDLRPLAKLKSILYLDLRHNEIEDLTPLVETSELIYLYLQGNRVKDPKPLAKLKNLSYVGLKENPIGPGHKDELRAALPKTVLIW